VRCERGQTTAEYVGLLLIVAAAMTAVVASSLGDVVIAKVDCAIEGILGDGEGCDGGQRAGRDRPHDRCDRPLRPAERTHGDR
jgi:hypothetical protein